MAVGQRFLAPRPGTREKVPRHVMPSVRDEGGTLERRLLVLLLSLQKSDGWAYAAEAGKRKMFAEDHGAMPGVMSIPEAEDRMEARGLLLIFRVTRGGEMPDGDDAKCGIRKVKVLTSQRERFAAREEYSRRLAATQARDARAQRPRRRIAERAIPRDVHKLLEGLRRPQQPWAPRAVLAGELDPEARRKRIAEQTQAAHVLELQWAAEDKAKGRDPPPE